MLFVVSLTFVLLVLLLFSLLKALITVHSRTYFT